VGALPPSQQAEPPPEYFWNNENQDILGRPALMSKAGRFFGFGLSGGNNGPFRHDAHQMRAIVARAVQIGNHAVTR